MKASLGILTISSCALFVAPLAEAGPLRKAAETVGDAAEYVGETVGDTASKIGESVKDTAKEIAGTNDPAEVRREVDTTEAQTLRRILSGNSSARALYDQAYGYAVFDSRKSSFIITAGTGLGVAVRKKSGERTYMRVATAGVNVGAGIQFYQGLFLFETKKDFDGFVNRGWQADATAGATLGKNSLEAQAKFTNGMAYYQVSDTGIMLDADISGTKYWKSSELNAKG